MILLRISLFLFFTYNLFATPTWMYKLPNSSVNAYIGYGSGKSMKNAKQEALEDISSQIGVAIKNSYSSQTKVLNKKITQKLELTSSQKTDVLFSDYTILRSEEEEEKYYIALQYENIPAIDKFINKIQNLTEVESVKKNTYLQETPIGKSLYKRLGKNINFQLVRSNNKWFIAYKQILQLLDSRDFLNFFVSIDNDNLVLQTDKKNDILHNGEVFKLDIYSTYNGYLSLLTVYEDGTVAILEKNKLLKAKQKSTFPDENNNNYLEAGLIKEEVTTFDMYVAIFSTEKLHLDSFAYADSSLICEEKYKNFPELLEFLQDKSYTTLKVTTKP